jgi:hypothetical protein
MIMIKTPVRNLLHVRTFYGFRFPFVPEAAPTLQIVPAPADSATEGPKRVGNGDT